MTHNYTAMGDRYNKVATCNSRKTNYHYSGGSSGQLKLLNLSRFRLSCGLMN